MKNKLVWFSLFVSFLFASCEDDIERIELIDDVGANVLQPVSGTTFVLDREQASQPFTTFEWSAPDFGFSAATSYAVQIARAENNFSPFITIATTTNNTASVTVGELNTHLLNLGIDPEEQASVQVRVRSTINANVDAVYSNTITFSVTPFGIVFPPIYMIGDATGGWDLNRAVSVRSTAPGRYETTAQFTNNGKFRFFETPSWDAPQRGYPDFQGGTIDSRLASGLDGDGNFLFTGTTGWYRIVIDVNARTFSMTPTLQPRLFMVGDALQGWDFGQAVELTRLSDGVYRVTTTFTSNQTFRFFTALDWAADIRYAFFANGNVSPIFAAANDNDDNFRFVGSTGTYTIRVDLNELRITEEDAEPALTQLFMVGDAVNGWDFGTAIILQLNGGVLQATTTFTNGGKFRFFEAADWGAPQWTFNDFTTIDSRLEHGADAENNFLFNGTTGTYVIKVNIQNSTIVLED